MSETVAQTGRDEEEVFARHTLLSDQSLAENDHQFTDPVIVSALEALVKDGQVSVDALSVVLTELELNYEEKIHFLEQLDELGVKVIEPEETPGEDPDIRATQGDRMSIDTIGVFLDQAGDHPILTAEQEVALAQRIENGDLQAKEEMVMCNIKLVVSIAKNYQGKGVEFLDLTQEGIIALDHAVDKFDWRKGFKLSTYATWWIRQACQRAIADTSTTIRIPVHIHEKKNTMSRHARELSTKLGRQPTLEEIAEAAGFELKEAREIWVTSGETTSLNSPIGDGDAEFGDLLSHEDGETTVNSLHQDLKNQALAVSLAQLPKQERQVLEMRYGLRDGAEYTLEEIGKSLGLSREKVRVIEANALGMLARHSELRDAVADPDNFKKEGEARYIFKAEKTVRVSNLSDDQNATLSLIYWGYTNDEIVRIREVSHSSVKTCVKNAKVVLGKNGKKFKDRLELAEYALEITQLEAAQES
jgi:RNA polymerase primary sigma factor